MTARAFIGLWEETTSHLKHTIRAAQTVRDQDVSSDLLKEMARACQVNVDTMEFMLRKYDQRHNPPVSDR